MATPNYSFILLLLCFLVISSVPLGTSRNLIQENFLECLSHHSKTPIPVYTPNTYNYSSILQFTIQNQRFSSPTTPKPFLLITPLDESHVQATVICSRNHGFQIKTRSGGHDYDGLSYISDVPFVVLDLFNLRSINVNVHDSSAWVQPGATIGELYYKIAEKSLTLGFTAGFCPTVGTGGHFSGGGYGALLRKYGMAADHVIDARIVNANGEILNKESMGEDLFWAIRGGGGGSFGVILSWKIRLVSIPSTVTVFSITKTLEEGATSLIHIWQSVASKLPEDLFIRIILKNVDATRKGEKTIQASFDSLFLGRSEKLLTIMNESFPELGLGPKDCTEMTWIQSVISFAGFSFNGTRDVLFGKSAQPKVFYKAKSDYVTEPISETGLKEIWTRMMEEKESVLIFTPYGGRMNEISESEIPFPHRKGNLFKIQYLASWKKSGTKEAEKHINWIRRLYSYMAPYVSNSPRAAYLNYRDVDLGQSKNGTASYLQAEVWGRKYFKNNYERLVHVKTMVDPSNFFRNEQSIPSNASSKQIDISN